MGKKRYITIIVIGIIFILLIIIASYFAPDDRLSNILLTVFTALLGGAIAYYGVVKTIRHGIDERIIAERKHNIERKEDERKRFIPYLKVVTNDNKFHSCVKIDYKIFNEFDQEKSENKISYAIAFKSFFLKNITSVCVIIKEIMIGGKSYNFESIYILEPGETVKIDILENQHIRFPNLPNKISLLVNDMLYNRYSIECNPEYALPNNFIFSIEDGDCRTWLYECTITNCGFPELIKAGENK